MTQHTNVDSVIKAAQLTKPLEEKAEKKRVHILNNAATYISILVIVMSVVLYSYNSGFSSVYNIPVSAIPINLKSYIPIAVQVIGVMMWILYYVSGIKQEKVLKKRKYSFLRVMYGFLIISAFTSYNHIDRFWGSIWRLVIPLILSLLIELVLYSLRRPLALKAQTIDDLSYRKRIEDYVFDRILFSYFRYGICILVLAVILANPFGKLLAKTKCDYQVFSYDDKTFAVIQEYDDRVLAQQAIVNENVLYIDISDYRYIKKDGLKLVYGKYDNVSLLMGDGDV